MPLGNKPFENTVGKGEIAHNEQFLLFPVFSTGLDNFLPFSSNLKLSSAKPFNSEESKICHLVMGQVLPSYGISKSENCVVKGLLLTIALNHKLQTVTVFNT